MGERSGRTEDAQNRACQSRAASRNVGAFGVVCVAGAFRIFSVAKDSSTRMKAASRIDVREAMRVDEITAVDVAAMVTTLHAAGAARETIRKSRTAIAMVLDRAGIAPNPARDRSIRLPLEEPKEISPPTADAIEAVARLLPSAYRFALLVLDATGCRVGEMEAARVLDLDESRQAFRVRAAVSKTRRARWIVLPDDLWTVLLDRLPPREDRDPDARLFGSATADRLRTAIARACTATGVPHFSPHDLRHRRVLTAPQAGIFVGRDRRASGAALACGHRGRLFTHDRGLPRDRPRGVADYERLTIRLARRPVAYIAPRPAPIPSAKTFVVAHVRQALQQTAAIGA